MIPKLILLGFFALSESLPYTVHVLYNSHTDLLFSLIQSERLPYSVRVLLESAVRNCDNFHVTQKDIQNILEWETNQNNNVEIPFKPSRVILQDFT